MKNKIENIVFESIKDLNELLNDENKLDLNENEKLLDSEGKIDSIDIVNLVSIIEDKIFEEFGKSPIIVSERAFSRKDSPFKDVKTIIIYLTELMEGE